MISILAFAAIQSSSVVTSGPYQIQLRVPPEGLFASEQLDLEFRVTDTRSKDAVEDGFKGVGGIKATAKVTMPSMAGMPSQLPKIHREGVPGDYGIELFFPHGGEYQIDLMLIAPSGEEAKATFKVAVKDERPQRVATKQPYRLQIFDWPKTARAGKPETLKMRVIDVKTSRAVTSFDVAHEKKFHLLLASKDLNWFAHEHPEMEANGTWSIQQTFPAGGEYWVYGDVAPTGMGSRILVGKVKVAGPPGSWPKTFGPKTTAIDGGLRGTLAPVAPIKVGVSTTMRAKLFDAKTGKPAGDTKAWLGAAGHLMMIHQDGTTMVHSHPLNDDATLGVIDFGGRFPKPGLYKAYVQVDWRGAIRTLGFGINVK